VGLLARTAEDAALTLATIVPAVDGRGLAGEAFLDAYRAAVTRGLRGRRVGVARGDFFDRLEPGVRRAVEATIDALRGAGARVSDVSVPANTRLYDDMFGPIAVSEIRATYARAFRARPDAFSPDFAAVFGGSGPTAAAVANAREARDAVQRSIEATLEDVDVILTPTVPMVAPPIAGPIDGMRILQNTWVFNAARVPAVSVPCGTGAQGLPVGLQLAGRPFREPTLLAAATLVERLGHA
jgi:aspartyl-tRNA(Asn)/glutamyl-tRNA(Gln) amidotransferase subunit A